MITASHPSSSSSSSHLLRDKAFRRCYSLPPLRPARTAHVPRFSASCAAARARERERTTDSNYYYSRSYSTGGGAAGTLATGATLYDVLGLTAAATPQEIKAAYRRLARACHPDVVATGRKGASADEFMRVHAAYATLSDPSKRAEYDRRFMVRRPPLHPSFSWPPSAADLGGSYYSPPSPASPRPSHPSPSFGRRTWETDQCW
ncbi:hypothetical protein Taro_038124 [Colocasia esculenta]|uniref:J domain-containing protein n=1 Tax=Colocasia esculenta TaxID=4460 RepID=A0A843WI88_COLES|nr:hypothetical protein [Colocasia esculenta]